MSSPSSCRRWTATTSRPAASSATPMPSGAKASRSRTRRCRSTPASARRSIQTMPKTLRACSTGRTRPCTQPSGRRRLPSRARSPRSLRALSFATPASILRRTRSRDPVHDTCDASAFLLSARHRMSEANVEDVFVEVPGGRVFVRRWGREHASSLPVVLLHDSLGSVEQWRDFPAVLAHRLDRPVIAYDRLGFGRSSARGERPSIHFIAEEADVHFPRCAMPSDWRPMGCSAIAWVVRWRWRSRRRRRIWPESSRAAKRLWLEYLLVRLRWLESSRLRAVASGGEQPRHHREGRKHQEGQGMRGLKHGGGNDRGGPQQRVCDLQVFAHDDLQWMRWQKSTC